MMAGSFAASTAAGGRNYVVQKSDKAEKGPKTLAV